jgi:hypothetical protein
MWRLCLWKVFNKWCKPKSNKLRQLRKSNAMIFWKRRRNPQKKSDGSHLKQGLENSSQISWSLSKIEVILLMIKTIIIRSKILIWPRELMKLIWRFKKFSGTPQNLMILSIGNPSCKCLSTKNLMIVQIQLKIGMFEF